MARILSQTLIRASILTKQTPPPNPLPSSRFLNHRSRSNTSEKGQFIEVDLETETIGGGGGEFEVLSCRRLEDAIHGIVVKRSAPDWLPFIPGSSYWVPPRKRPYGYVELVEKLASPLTEEESLSFSSLHGFPSSSYFLHGATPYPVEMQIHSESLSQSEDEEG